MSPTSIESNRPNRIPFPAARARWWHRLFAPVVLLFLVQVFTGIVLMTVYSPSTATAWGSVRYIQSHVPAGWVVRGIHHFASDVLLAVLVLACLRMVVTAGYRHPRASVWWLTLALLAVALAGSLTGHLLPWDQGGYWGTMVRVNILGRTPLVGDAIRRLVVGGSELGQLTLTRFYTLHVAIFSVAMGMLVFSRARLIERCHHSVAGGDERAGAGEDTSARLVRTTAAGAIVLVATFAALWYARTVLHTELLDAPADPASADYPARPEWHTLFLYQWLKHFSGVVPETIGAIIVPGLIALIFVAFPWFDRALRPRPARGAALGVTGVVLMGVVLLTLSAVLADINPSDDEVEYVRRKQTEGSPLTPKEQSVLRARRFNERRERARQTAGRAFELAAQKGIPPEGPLALLYNDPYTRGPVLFAAHCAACHRFDGHDGLGQMPPEPATSSDLAGFATRLWVRGLLDDPMGDRYFGRMKKPDGEPAHTRMSRWTRSARGENSELEARQKLTENFDAVAAYYEDESLFPGRLARVTSEDLDLLADQDTSPPGADDQSLIARGRRFFLSVCNECHSYNGDRTGTFRAPEMRGYGSVVWLELMIAEPAHDTRYRSRGKEPAQMPPFRDTLTEHERRMLARWLHDTRSIGE